MPLVQWIRQNLGARYVASPLEAVPLAESLTPQLHAAATAADVVVIAESASVKRGARATPAETVGLSEAVSPRFNAHTALAEAEALANAIVVSRHFTATPSESMTIAELVAAMARFSVAALSTVSASENIAVIGGALAPPVYVPMPPVAVMARAGAEVAIDTRLQAEISIAIRLESE